MREKWETLQAQEQKLILDLRENGPDCAKFLSRRHGLNLRDTMDMLSCLEARGWLERVKGTFLFKRGFKKPKHMNHTYYSVTRRADRFLRGF